eukprot:Partr_v1_DN27939_c0_g1_i3_m11347 putative RNA polymerase II subunit A C-terminal domain phosphatase
MDIQEAPEAQAAPLAQEAEIDPSRKVRFAVICASNQNRSMEAHNVLRNNRFNVKSYGTGTQVRLPGPTPDKPNVYQFNTPYDDMYADLQEKDYEFYTENGLLAMLDRNRKIKRAPQRWHEEQKETYDVVITCEERCFDSVCEDLLVRGMPMRKPVHVINVEIRDNHEDAAVGGQIILGVANLIESVTDIHAEMESLLDTYLKENPSAPLTYTLSYY